MNEECRIHVIDHPEHDFNALAVKNIVFYSSNLLLPELHPSENASPRTHSQHSKDPHLLRALAKKLKSNKQDIYFMFFNNFFLSNFAELSLGELLYGCLQHTTLECFL